MSDGFDDDVAAGVHHERCLPPPLVGKGACAFAEGDDTEGAHQVRAEDDDTEGVHQALALTSEGGEARVPEDADSVVHDLSVLIATLPLDGTRATLDTALMLFLMKLFRTRLSVCPTFLVLHCIADFEVVSTSVLLSAWPGHAHSTMRCPRAMG